MPDYLARVPRLHGKRHRLERGSLVAQVTQGLRLRTIVAFIRPSFGVSSCGFAGKIEDTVTCLMERTQV